MLPVTMKSSAKAHQMNLLTFVTRELRFQFCFQSIQRHIREYGRDYTTNNVAKKVIEFSITVPREQLRPNYGDGFRGAPLKITKRPSGSVKGNRGADDCQKEEESESETNV
ncbi:MAG: hypothetical protein IPJ94_24475 [Chloroflexi bacterium]|nr:hypothetical protein [Chloroflexota bacterium]